MRSFKKYIVNKNYTIRNTLKKMSDNKENFCIFVDKNIVKGMFTEGDFRQSVYIQKSLDDKIEPVINKEFKFVSKNYSNNEVSNIFKNSIVREIPVLEKGRLKNIIFRNDFYKKINHRTKSVSKNTKVVVMAGGLGTRLDPFTRILPKPLIPLGKDPAIKVIMDKFYEYGLNNFIISLGEKSKMIKSYFSDYRLPYKIKYVEEKNPLGTVGALRLMKNILNKDFFLVNGDTIITTDYPNLLMFHKKHNHYLTLVGAVQNYKLPFGICNFDQNGKLISFKEKPSFDHVINSGLYLVNKKVIKFIPKNKRLDLSELIKILTKKKLSIGVYPISESSWMDIGQHNSYKKALSKL